MIEPVDLRIDNLNPEKGLPSKRFGLFTVGKDGRPDAHLGRYDTYYEVMSKCSGSSPHFLVEVSHYAFLRVDDFAELFGPLPHLRETSLNT